MTRRPRYCVARPGCTRRPVGTIAARPPAAGRVSSCAECAERLAVVLVRWPVEVAAVPPVVVQVAPVAKPAPTPKPKTRGPVKRQQSAALDRRQARAICTRLLFWLREPRPPVRYWIADAATCLDATRKQVERAAGWLREEGLMTGAGVLTEAGVRECARRREIHARIGVLDVMVVER